ncbi:hypothetical protein JOC77_003530 [Peribacillus deserti]|uniref:Fur-regulated basic protein FbpA n=1 Tax=Peribacillus deserti TaxID=673318 RepID=A0ABS2QLN2_9BACI|nr:hypothetical protein [Peribacillus deserti]
MTNSLDTQPRLKARLTETGIFHNVTTLEEIDQEYRRVNG